MARRILISLILVAAVATSSPAQERVKEVTPIDSVRQQVDTVRRPTAQQYHLGQGVDEYQQKLSLARRLISTRNYEGAAALLETLYEQRPQDAIVQSLLMTSYLQLQRYPAAEDLARKQVQQRPENLSYRITLAEVFAQQGMKDSARVTYNEALGLVSTNNRSQYLIVIRSMVSHNMEDRALTVIDSVRTLLDDPIAFANERGELLKAQRKYAEATREYLNMLVEDTTFEARNAEREILELLNFPESEPVAEKILVESVRSEQSTRATRLLTSHYLRARRFDDAFAFAVKNDSLDNREGATLLGYMRQCRDHEAWAPIVRMGDYLFSAYPQAPFESQAKFIYAEGLAELGQPDSAIAIYEQIIAANPKSPSAYEALYGIGSIYFNKKHEYAEALLYFDSVVSGPRRDVTYLNARKAIPYCHLRLGNIDAARKSFSELAGLKLNDELAEEVDYNLGLIDLFQKRYDSAEVALRKLMVDYPRGYYVNDALEHLMIISEATNAGMNGDTLLYDYSNAVLFEERLMYDSALVRYAQLSDDRGQPLADMALYRQAKLLLMTGDSAMAIRRVDTLTGVFPESYYTPYGMKLKADVLFEDEATRDEAEEIYGRILEAYPNLPFITEVRRRLRQLQIDSQIG